MIVYHQMHENNLYDIRPRSDFILFCLFIIFRVVILVFLLFCYWLFFLGNHISCKCEVTLMLTAFSISFFFCYDNDWSSIGIYRYRLILLFSLVLLIRSLFLFLLCFFQINFIKNNAATKKKIICVMIITLVLF
jgi:hypothetical protein